MFCRIQDKWLFLPPIDTPDFSHTWHLNVHTQTRLRNSRISKNIFCRSFWFFIWNIVEWRYFRFDCQNSFLLLFQLSSAKRTIIYSHRKPFVKSFVYATKAIPFSSFRFAYSTNWKLNYIIFYSFSISIFISTKFSHGHTSICRMLLTNSLGIIIQSPVFTWSKIINISKSLSYTKWLFL